jgi:hypothetical protein
MNDVFLVGFIGGGVSAGALFAVLYYFLKSSCQEFQQTRSEMWKTAALIRLEAKLQIVENDLELLKLQAKPAKAAKAAKKVVSDKKGKAN